MAECQLPKLNTRVRFPFGADGTSFVTGFFLSADQTREDRTGDSLSELSGLRIPAEEEPKNRSLDEIAVCWRIHI